MLDRFLPDYDVHEVHSTLIAAQPEAVLEAIHAVTAREVPLMVVLTALRTGPRLRRHSLTRPVLSQFERAGFVPLHDGPDGLVYGVAGRFWTPSGGVRPIEPAEFAGFDEPGYAKGAFSFELEPQGDRVRLTTETRVLCTDDRARRRFRRYWRLVHPGSALIRIVWLRAIRRRAERAGYAPSGSSPASARS
jgi:hypothetical protein